VAGGGGVIAGGVVGDIGCGGAGIGVGSASGIGDADIYGCVASGIG